jgi:hypothetical protein
VGGLGKAESKKQRAEISAFSFQLSAFPASPQKTIHHNQVDKPLE